MISRIDHVSIAVRDYDEAWHFFVDILGAVPGAFGEEDAIKYFWRVFSLGDLSRLELIKMTGKGSFLEGFLSSRHGGVHHITLETPDMDACRRHLEKHGIPYFGYRTGGELYGDSYKELFIHPRDAFGALIQIAEMDPTDYLDDTMQFPQGQRWSVEKKASGVEASFAHPGAGKVTLEMTDDEIRQLIQDLTETL